jgi:hypothetical protein
MHPRTFIVFAVGGLLSVGVTVLISLRDEPNGNVVSMMSGNTPKAIITSNQARERPADVLYDAAVKEIEAKIPELNPDSQFYSAQLAAVVIGKRDAYEKQGMAAHIALRRAVDETQAQRRNDDSLRDQEAIHARRFATMELEMEEQRKRSDITDRLASAHIAMNLEIVNGRIQNAISNKDIDEIRRLLVERDQMVDNAIYTELTRRETVARAEEEARHSIASISRQNEVGVSSTTGGVNVITGEALIPSGPNLVGTRDGKLYIPVGPNTYLDSRTGKNIQVAR